MCLKAQKFYCLKTANFCCFSKQNKGYNYVYDTRGLRLLSSYNKHSKFPLYQPYFKPTNRISDYGILNSTGPVGFKVLNQRNFDDLKVCYTDKYADKDLTCVFVIVDIGKNSKVNLKELFENKDGCKIYYVF